MQSPSRQAINIIFNSVPTLMQYPGTVLHCRRQVCNPIAHYGGKVPQAYSSDTPSTAQLGTLTCRAGDSAATLAGGLLESAGNRPVHLVQALPTSWGPPHGANACRQ
jgi:hypothetical protein